MYVFLRKMSVYAFSPFSFSFSCLFKATPMPYGDSQARGQIGATAVSLLHNATVTAMPDLSLICDLHHSLQQHRILNLLSEARILMDTSQIRFC